MYAYIDGKRHCFSRRKYCFNCSPFGEHNVTNLVKNPDYIVEPKEIRKLKTHKRALINSVNKTREKRQKRAIQMVEYKGGKCAVCGYSKCISALEFHHRDPKEKKFNLASKAYARSWEVVKEELDKCDLLCANCHREEHERLRNKE